MILLILRVVLDEFLDVELDEVDLGEDFVGGGGPGEWLRVAVPVRDVVADLCDQDFHRGEAAPADGLPSDDRKPGFESPRRVRRLGFEDPYAISFC